MLSRGDIKWLQSLHQKKFRQKYNKFLVEGDKIGRELLQHSNWKIHAVYALDSWLETNHADWNVPEDQLFKVSLTDLQRISTLSTPQPLVIVAEMPEPEQLGPELRQSWSLYLDGVQDPGNVGTILRIADWFGLPYVFCGPGTAEVYNPKVIQASMGAFLRIKTLDISLLQLQETIPGIPVAGAVLEGDNLYQASLPEAGILVVGNESKGISPENQPLLTQKWTIPKPPGGGAESLNVSVATGIVCAWLRREV